MAQSACSVQILRCFQLWIFFYDLTFSFVNNSHIKFEIFYQKRKDSYLKLLIVGDVPF
jgi:hypothetical protein